MIKAGGCDHELGCSRLILQTGLELHPQTDLMAALRTMDEAEVSQAPVVFEQEVRGILSRERVLHYISLRSLLRA